VYVVANEVESLNNKSFTSFCTAFLMEGVYNRRKM